MQKDSLLRLAYLLSATLLLESMAYLAVFAATDLQPPHNKPLDVALLICGFAYWKLFLGASISVVAYSSSGVPKGLWRRAHVVLTLASLVTYGVGFVFSAAVLFLERVHGLPLSLTAVPAAFGPLVYLAYSVLCFVAVRHVWRLSEGTRSFRTADGLTQAQGTEGRKPPSTVSRAGPLILIIACLVSCSGFLGCIARLQPPALREGELWVEFRVISVDLESRTLVIEQVFNEPDDIAVGGRVPVRDNATIVLRSMVRVGDQVQLNLRRGSLNDIVPGQDGALILGTDGFARYVTVSDGGVLPPGG